jgi:hypothetical protein
MRDYPIEKTRNIGIIAHIDVPIYLPQSGTGKSRILDFSISNNVRDEKSGPEKLL